MGLVLLFLLLFPVCVNAQQRPSVQITRYNEANGGPSGLVNCIYQAKSGFLWFGCSNGLVRYDGYTFSLFSNEKGSPSNVTHVTEDKYGNLWVSFAEGGIARYSPLANHFTNFALENEKEPGLRSVQIMTLFFDKVGWLWIGTAQKGLLRFDERTRATSLYPLTDQHHASYAPALRNIYNTVYAISEDEKGTLWLASHDGLYTLSKGASAPVSVRPGLVQPNTFRKDLFTDLLPEDNHLWLSAWAGGLWMFQKEENRWVNFVPNEKGLGKGLTNIITSIGPKDEEELWVCTSDKGLGIFNKRNKSFLFFRDYIQHPDLPPTEVHGMKIDKDKNVWAIHEQRLVKLQIRNPIFHFSTLPVTRTDNQDGYGIVDLWEDDQLRLIATDYADGVHVLNKQTGRSSILSVGHLPNEEASMQVRQIYNDSKGRIWIVSRDLIYQYDRNNNKLTKTIQPPLYSSDSLTNNFSTMMEDKVGKIWIATRRAGLYVWDDVQQTFEHYSAEAPGVYRMPANHIRSLAIDGKGRRWIAGIDGVLGYIQPGDKKFTAIPIDSDGKGTIPGNKSFVVHADKVGNVWAGTTTGLYCFDASQPEPQLRKVITAADGLRSDPVYSIAEDKGGNIWCLNEAGVCFLPSGGTPIANYSLADGIKRGTGTKLLATTSDTLLLLNYGGYYRFVPNQLTRVANHSPVVITAIQVAGKPFAYGEQLLENKRIQLGVGQNYFSFEFAALSFTHPEKQQYAYMLEGVDKDWIQAGNRRFVSYTNVPGGDYTFKVKLVDVKDVGHEKVLSIPLSVATPFYKTPWFFALLAFVIAAVLYAVHRSRVSHHNQVFSLETKTQRLEKEKALVMYEGLKQQLNPHFLFNSLTSLNSLILRDPQAARRFLEGLSNTYRYILKSRESEVVELAKEVTIAETYVQLQKTRFKKALQVRFRVSEEYESCKIVPVTLQNLIENAMKHNILDNDSPLFIEIYTEDGYIIVQNTLQKKKIVETSNRQGLRSLKTLYGYLTDRPVVINETADYFTVSIPLIS